MSFIGVCLKQQCMCIDRHVVGDNFELNRGINTKRQFLVCATIALSKVHFDLVSIFSVSFLADFYYLFLGAFVKLRRATISFVMSVRLSFCQTNRLRTGLIFMKFDI